MKDRIDNVELDVLLTLEEKVGKINQIGRIDWDTFGYVIKDNKITELGLYNKNITELPNTISDLKNLRKSVGIDLQEVFEVTRVSIPTLKSIEENEFEKLPPIIYLKNFLKSLLC